MPVVKNIKQRTTNNSFNTYPIGMNAEFITIPAGTANLYENNVNTDEGMNILKNYIDEQLSNARVSFFVNYTDINNQVYNLRVYNDNSTNGSGLRNVINNLPENISNLSVKQLYAPNFTQANGLFFNKRNIYNINNISFLNLIDTYAMFNSCTNLSTINTLDLGFNIKNTSWMFSNCYNLTTIPNFYTLNVINMIYMFSNCSNLINIPLFNTSNVIDIHGMFEKCTNLTTIPNFNTINVINMHSMFEDCSNLINIPNFNTSNVTDMYSMFEFCPSLTNIPNFNTKNVINMSYMFSQCRNLTNIPNFNTKNVTNMQRIFQTCYNLTNIPNFDTSNVTDMTGAFLYCSNLVNINKLNLNKATEIFVMIRNCGNLSNSSILNIANSLPYYDNIINANKYNTLDYIGFSDEQIKVIINNPYASNYVENHGWSLPKVNYELAYTNTSNPDVWINYNLLNQPITSNAKTLRDAFRNKNIDTANVVKLNVINLPGVTNGSYLFAYNGSNYNFSKMTNVEHLDMEDLQDASDLFYNDVNLTSANNINCNNIINTAYMFTRCKNLTNISNFDTSNVTNMRMMFGNCQNLTNIPNFNTSNVTDMRSMFDECINLNNVPNFNTSNVINMGYMFSECKNIITIPNFDTSKVTNMRFMFGSGWTGAISMNGKIKTIPNFNTINVTDMGDMFSMGHPFITIPNFNTSNVIYMNRMFYGCRMLTTMPNFDTSKVTNMSHMFSSCANLITIPNFDTSSVISMSSMFNFCSNLSNQSIDNIAYSLPLYKNIINGNPLINQYLDLTNTQINNMSINAKEAAENKGWMVLPQIRIDYTYLNGVNGVNKIYNIDTMTGQEQYRNLYGVLQNSNLNVENMIDVALYASDNNINNMFNLFRNFNAMKNINIQINTSNVTNTSWMFGMCSNLINISNFNTSNVTDMYGMFVGCFNLVNIPNFNMNNITRISRMFASCYNLTTIPNFDTSNVTDMSGMFYYCKNLVNVPLFDMSNVININEIFDNCSNLSQNSLQNIIQSIPSRTQIENTTSTTNLQYLGLTANQINSLPNHYKQIAADKNWYVEGYEAKGRELIVGTANILGDITFDESEEYPMTLTYDDMFGDYCLENTNQGKANTDSSAILTVSEDILNIFDPMWNFQVYYSSEKNYDEIKIYKNGDLLYEYSGYSGDTYLEAEFWLEVQAGDVLEFIYHKDSSGDNGLDGCKIYISGWKNNKSYEVKYSTVDAPTTYITKFIPKEDN